MTDYGVLVRAAIEEARAEYEAKLQSEQKKAEQQAQADKQADEFTTFVVGQEYTHGWIGDSDLFTTWTVVSRTKCMITIKHNDEIKKCRIIKGLSDMEKCECIKPYGQYSMSPTLRANQSMYR